MQASLSDSHGLNPAKVNLQLNSVWKSQIKQKRGRDCLINKVYHPWGAAIAQWIPLHLPSCHPGFEAQEHHYAFINLNLKCVMWKSCK